MTVKTFEDLQNLGIEKIHERTHISRDKIELVLSKSFAQIGKVQFMGYISILEREYLVDLMDIRQAYLEFCHENADIMAPKQSVILQTTSNSKPKWVAFGIALIVVLMIGGYFLQGKISAVPEEEVINLITAAVEPVEEVNDTNVSDLNDTNMTSNIVVNEVNQTQSPDEKSVLPSGNQITIRPAYKLWYGMIDTKSGERIQQITSEPFTIDAKKNWLIFLGHGRVEIESEGSKTALKGKETVRFVCENGMLKEISRDEFIKRNNGKNW